MKNHSKSSGIVLLETRRITKLGIALIVPVKTRLLIEAFVPIKHHHIYEADALQLATAKHINAEKLVIEKVGLQSIYLG